MITKDQIDANKNFEITKQSPRQGSKVRKGLMITIWLEEKDNVAVEN